MSSVLRNRLLPRGERGHSPPRDQVQKFKLQVKERDKKVKCTCRNQVCVSAYAYLSILLCYYNYEKCYVITAIIFAMKYAK